MSDAGALLGKQIEVQLSGEKTFKGILTDLGMDILVLYNGEHFLYFPMLQVHRFNLSEEIDSEIEYPLYSPMMEDMGSISYRKTLMNAKGMFSEIHVAGHIPLHGYITNVFNDYFAFYSPVYKTMYISLHHLKWLSPHNQGNIPYALSKECFPVNPSAVPMVRSLGEQLKKYAGKLVVLDGGEDPMKIGVLKTAANNLVELTTASGNQVFFKLAHIKSVYMP
ncbi:DUF2642 domain-containing protein [Peribacillus muralis]|uniref:DUF2642 domain-containing protein n=1 Tax=Peribacillus muralis TaxID=264697 RepID=UPI001F4D978F|nr:DUF2642 domain-containing protein [Peribacillus muralis]MCK1991986.1 DUF2642 domain-containing protein [Peribacillus muralis]MCK2012544.1 DUF2642 domain-containing protein [Peribacillus muralis]